MINPIEWFKQKGFSFDDEKITIKDVIDLQNDAWRQGVQDAAEQVHAEGLFRLSESLLEFRDGKLKVPCCDICSGTHETDDCL